MHPAARPWHNAQSDVRQDTMVKVSASGSNWQTDRGIKVPAKLECTEAPFIIDYSAFPSKMQ